MIFRDLDPEVAVVKDGMVTLKKVTILVDTGPEIEISNGLEPADKFVLNPSYAIDTGETVDVVKIDGKPVKPIPSSQPPGPATAHEAAK